VALEHPAVGYLVTLGQLAEVAVAEQLAEMVVEEQLVMAVFPNGSQAHLLKVCLL
jgi:hypothetical protein